MTPEECDTRHYSADRRECRWTLYKSGGPYEDLERTIQEDLLWDLGGALLAQTQRSCEADSADRLQFADRAVEVWGALMGLYKEHCQPKPREDCPDLGVHKIEEAIEYYARALVRRAVIYGRGVSSLDELAYFPSSFGVRRGSRLWEKALCGCQRENLTPCGDTSAYCRPPSEQVCKARCTPYWQQFAAYLGGLHADGSIPPDQKPVRSELDRILLSCAAVAPAEGTP